MSYCLRCVFPGPFAGKQPVKRLYFDSICDKSKKQVSKIVVMHIKLQKGVGVFNDGQGAESRHQKKMCCSANNLYKVDRFLVQRLIFTRTCIESAFATLCKPRPPF